VGSDRTGQAERVAHGHHKLADDELVRLAELGGLGRRSRRPQHRQVGERVGANRGERRRGAVAERGRAGLRVPHHVRVGQQEAIAGEHDGGTEALAAPPRAALGHAEAGHLAGEFSRDSDHYLGIRIKRGLHWQRHLRY
jgi:hypothetical protein